MSDHSSRLPPLPAAHRDLTDSARRRARAATMALFFVAGMMYASWGVHVPTVRDRFALSPAMLSLALLAVAIGSIVAMTTNAKWIARVGTRSACLAGGLGMCVFGALILLAPTYPLLVLVLMLFGFSMATLDVAMNAEASAVEIAFGRPIISMLHGMFSIGGMAGAALGGAALSAGMTPAVHLALASAMCAVVLIVACPAVLPHVPHDEAAHGKSANRWRSTALWMLGAIALVSLIAEGAMYDWATVYMRDVVAATPAFASAAYAAFSGGMAVGRFAGDVVRSRFGAPQLVFASASFACAGMVGALLLPQPAPALIGFMMMGLGLANMMPLLFAAAARVAGISPAEGLAHVAGLAYFGLMFGPVVIGGVAQAAGLTVGLWIVALCAAIVAATAPKVMRKLNV
ncbi:MFS transporter [Burkholderia sp. Ac-20379]|uniref:MFS transporter n=1 Tax=Burkholderia sp. Ac-20379 TaxID=2703900 RepID=UPI001D3E2300|nr:MFS transporter [Burkholderia sp. Ac-20379]